MTRRDLGNIRIDRIVESICTNFVATSFFPDVSAQDWKQHRPWLEPWALQPHTGCLVLPMQSFLLRTRHHTILVDTCVGDDKPRPHRPFWHMQNLDGFLPRLAAVGVAPEDIDYVFCTHMHVDHVGWNTRLRDGRWVPTFPKARYIFSRREWDSFDALHRHTPQLQFADSVLPIMESGQAQLVNDDFVLDDEVSLLPTPGHTTGHVSVSLTSAGAEALITGDCIHSPLQCLNPKWIMRADVDAALAGETRRRFLERCCERGALVCATHFPEPSFGRVSARGDAFWFEFDRQS